MSAFGDYLRGARLGYRPVPVPGGRAWMRIEAGGPPWRVSIARDAREMGALEERGGRNHVCWWEGDGDGARIVAASPVLSTLSPSMLPCVLWLNDDGERPGSQTNRKGGTDDGR